MRTRTSNKAKRYRPSDLDPTLGSDDEEIASVPARATRGESEDGYREDDAAGTESDAKDDEKLDVVESSEPESEPEAAPARQRTVKPPAARPRKKEVPAQSVSAKPLNVVPDYPLDPSAKWTRAYTGPLKRWTRFHDMVILLYGDRDDYSKIVSRITRVWWDFQVLPPRPVHEKHMHLSAYPWTDASYVKEQQSRIADRLKKYASGNCTRQSTTVLDATHAYSTFLPSPDAELTVLLGDHEDRQAFSLRPGNSIYLSEYGIALQETADDVPISGGWMLDVGGIVVAMNWAPTSDQHVQFLAVSVIPDADQAYQPDLSKAPTAESQQEGSVQIWKFDVEKDDDGVVRPALRPPQLVQAVCSLWGRIARIQWCPIPIGDEESSSLLGVLCSDGRLRVIEVKKASDPENIVFEQIQDAMMTIEIPNEHTVAVTCFTWVNWNRIAVGCSDGSIALWSLFPCQMLQRHPIHCSSVIDIASGYPSQPSHITSLPLGGVLTLTDLNRPTAEMSYNANLLVSLQPNLLAWSEVLRGYLSMWPTNFTANSTVSFSGLTTFPQPRHIMTVESQVTCLGMGPCHPYLLVGTSDGSLWSTNVLRKIMGYREKVNKMRILKHEYRPVRTGPEQARSRGVARITNGYFPEVNDHPRANFTGKAAENKKSKKKKAHKKGQDDIVDDDDDGFDNMDEGGAMTFATGPLIVEDPHTRITAIAWNPNAVFSCWAAVAMGSGVVRVTDLGIEGLGDTMDKSDADEEMPDVDEEGV